MNIIHSSLGSGGRANLGTRSLRDVVRSRGTSPKVTPGLARLGHALSGEFLDLAHQYANASNPANRCLVLQRGVTRVLASKNAIRHLNQIRAADVASALQFVGIKTSSGRTSSTLASLLLVALAIITQAPLPDVGLMSGIELQLLKLSPEALAELGADVGPAVVEAVVEEEVAVGLLAQALAAVALVVTAVAELPSAMVIGIIVFVAVVAIIVVRHVLGG